MKTNKFFILIIGILFCGSTAFTETKNTKHDFGCKECHSVHHAKGQRALWPTELKTEDGTIALTPVDAMCYTCHKEEDKGGKKFFMPGHSHPINVKPSNKVKIPKILGTTYIEGIGRVITCVSCHDPHSSEKKFLKVTMEDDLLCRSCHQNK
jgi:predicted CXXCH cytochrome family protein